MRILNYGSDYAHERKLQKEEENKKNAVNNNTAARIIPEELEREVEGLGHNSSEDEAKTQEKETEEKNEAKRGRKPKGKV